MSGNPQELVLDSTRNASGGDLLYFNPSAFGGLADYAHEQANALADAGCEVLMVCPLDFKSRPGAKYSRREYPVRARTQSRSLSKLGRALRMARATISAWNALAVAIEQVHARRVLLGAYSEYFSPLWSRRFNALSRKGVVFGAVVHDPIRDAVLGPAWWHRWSVQTAYSFLKLAFVHEQIESEALGASVPLEVLRIPHGPYQLGVAERDREATRAALGIPKGVPTFVAFGHIRDNKNLDLAIKALARLPEAHLIVAGCELSGRERPSSFYVALAESEGVADRCHWLTRYIPDNEAASVFEASDAVLLNYGASFKSASGVLAAAVGFRKPCVASSGAGPLKHLVEEYSLGPWVEPDSLDSLVAGMEQIPAWRNKPEWDRFQSENSWEQNARIVASSFDRIAIGLHRVPADSTA